MTQPSLQVLYLNCYYFTKITIQVLQIFSISSLVVDWTLNLVELHLGWCRCNLSETPRYILQKEEGEMGELLGMGPPLDRNLCFTSTFIKEERILPLYKLTSTFLLNLFINAKQFRLFSPPKLFLSPCLVVFVVGLISVITSLILDYLS